MNLPRYILNLEEIKMHMQEQNIKSITQLINESGLDPSYFFRNKSKHHNKPVTSLNTIYKISRRLGCNIEDILIIERAEDE